MKSFPLLWMAFLFLFYQDIFLIATNKNKTRKHKQTMNFIKVDTKNPRNAPVAAFNAPFLSSKL
jgi:hypothetical protein